MTEFGVRVPLQDPTGAIEESGSFCEAMGLQIHMNSAGNGDPMVVLHHSSGPFWSNFYDCLAKTFRVLALDMPGYGQSERLESARSPANLAAVLHRLIDALDLEKPHLLGLGFGGYVASEMVVVNPTRFRTLTLVGSTGIRPQDGFIYDPMTESWTSYMQRYFSSEDAFEAIFGSDPPQQLIDLWDHSREMTSRVTWRPWMWSLQLPDLLRGVRTPTLIVWGSQDSLVPLDCAHQFAALLTDHELEIVEGAGHAVELEQPAEVARLIDAFAASHN